MREFVLQKSPVPKTGCLITSFAMCMDIPVAQLLDELGHDGRIEAWPLMPEPYCWKGIHPQECVDLAIKHGYSATLIDPFPMSATIGSVHDVPVFKLIDAIKRLTNLQMEHRGVLLIKTETSAHAVAWDTKNIYDPKGSVYGYDKLVGEIYQFYIVEKMA